MMRTLWILISYWQQDYHPLLTQVGNMRTELAESFVAADDAYSVGVVDSDEILKSVGFQQQAVERLLQ